MNGSHGFHYIKRTKTTICYTFFTIFLEFLNVPRSIVIVHCQMIPRLCDTNTQAKLTKVAHNTTDDDACDVEYNFAFDGAGRPTTVQVGSQTLSTTVYNPDGTVQKVTYGNSSACLLQQSSIDIIIIVIRFNCFS